MHFLAKRFVQVLRWSERYTKTDMVYLTKEGGLLGLGQGVTALAGFITALCFANFLSKEIYGTYKFVLSVTALLSITTLSGMGVAVTRAVARGFDGTLDAAVRTKIQWGLLGSVGGLVAASYYYLQGNTLLAISFFVVALFLPVMEAFGIYDSFLQGKKAFGTSIRYSVFSKIVSTLSTIGVLFFTDNIFALLLGYFLPFTLIRFIFLTRTRRLYKQNDLQEHDVDVFGKHLSVMGVLSTIANQLDKLLVFSLLGSVELAVYAIASAPVDQIKGLVDSISRIALPKFSQQDTSDIRHTIWRRMSLLLIGLGALSVVYWLAAPFLFKILFSQYAQYTSLSQVFGLSIISFALFIPLQVLQGRQKTKPLYALNVTTSVVQIVLSVLGVLFFGLIGVIVARVLARFFNLTLYLVVLHFTIQK